MPGPPGAPMFGGGVGGPGLFEEDPSPGTTAMKGNRWKGSVSDVAAGPGSFSPVGGVATSLGGGVGVRRGGGMSGASGLLVWMPVYAGIDTHSHTHRHFSFGGGASPQVPSQPQEPPQSPMALSSHPAGTETRARHGLHEDPFTHTTSTEPSGKSATQIPSAA